MEHKKQKSRVFYTAVPAHREQVLEEVFSKVEYVCDQRMGMHHITTVANCKLQGTHGRCTKCCLWKQGEMYYDYFSSIAKCML